MGRTKKTAVESKKALKATKVEEKTAPVQAPVNPKPEAPAAPEATKAKVDRDAFGNRPGTRAAIINAVLFAADAANEDLTTNAVETRAQASEAGKAYALANNKQVGAVRNHLQSLLALKLVTNTGGKWRVVKDHTKAKELEARAAAVKAEAEKNGK